MPRPNGFALILSMVLVGFVLLLMLSLAALVSLETHNATQAKAMLTARQNAELALMTALGKLQSYAGPDQRVTATADILEGDASDFLAYEVSPEKKHWVGVWNTKDFNSDDTEVTRQGRNTSEKTDYESAFVGWLVSGDPTKTDTELTLMTDVEQDIAGYDDDESTALLLGSGSVKFQDDDPSDPTHQGVRVPKVSLPATAGFAGNYAYWVSDESVKARINLTNPYDDDELDPGDWMKRRTRQSIALRHGIEEVNDDDSDNFASFYTDFSDASIGRFNSTGDLLAASSALNLQDKYNNASRAAFHDLTPYSAGVLADVKNGGLKKDLSLAFEISDEAFQSSSLINSDDYNHRLDTRGTVNPDYFGNSNLLLGFLFAEDTGDTHQGGASTEPLIFRGPTWQLLRSFYQLYRKVDQSETSPTLLAQAHRPNMPDGVQVNDTIPAQVHTDTGNEITSDWDNHYSQHVNNNNPSDFVLRSVESQLAPLLLRSTYIFSLKRRSGSHELGLCIDYVGVIYNPYNVNLEFKGFKVLLQSMPVFLKFTKYKDVAISDEETITGEINYGYYGFEYFLLQNYGGSFSDVPNSSIGDLNNPVWGNFILTSDGTKNPSGNQRITLRPGELRLISLNNSSPQDAEEIGLPMSFGWNQDGGLFFDMIDLGTQPAWKLGTKPKPTLPEAKTITVDNDERISVHLKNYYGAKSDPSKDENIIDRYKFNNEGKPALSDGETEYTFASSNPQGVDRTNTYSNFLYRTIQESAFSSYLIDDSTSNWSASFENPQPKQDHILSAYQFNVANSVYSLQETGQIDGDQLDEKYTFAIIDIFKKPTYPDTTHFPVPVLSQFNARSAGGWSRSVGGFGNDRSGLPNWDIEIDDKTGSANGLVQVAESTSDGAMWGNRITPNPTGGTDGQSRVVLFDVPTTPSISLASLQHADVGVMPDHPSYVIGNSYASPFIPTDNVWANPPNSKRSNFADMSYLANEALWDRYYFSGLTAAEASNYNNDTEINDVLETSIETFISGGTGSLNPNIAIYLPIGEDSTSATQNLLDIDFSDDSAQGLDKAAAFMMQQGAFNVNSTSVKAWKALLKGLHTESVEVTNTSGSTSIETNLDTALFSRTSLPAGNDDEPWRGYNTLTEAQLNALATAIVDEVKARGPFVSVADFVNRRLVSSSASHAEQGKKGTLQTALDKSSTDINSATSLRSSIDWTDTADNNSFSKPFPYDNLAAVTGVGAPGYLMQADVLAALGPYLVARSDTFIIRAYGDATNALTGEVIGQAWCEAVIQRFPDYVNANETKPYESPVGTSTVNENYGRQFRILSFRWLNEDEV